MSVRQGGSNPESNFRLRLAVQKARDNNMPVDNIEKAVKRGSGILEGVSLVEMTLEGYGPGGAAILVQALTDNHNRTLQEIRNVFSRHNGNLGENGCVAWLFEPRGLIIVKTDDLDAEELALQAIDVGAEDVKVEDDYVEIYTQPDELEMVRKALEQNGLVVDSAQLTMLSKTMVELEEKTSLQMLKLLDRLEELDEVQHVTTNADFPDSILEKYQAGVS